MQIIQRISWNLLDFMPNELRTHGPIFYLSPWESLLLPPAATTSGRKLAMALCMLQENREGKSAQSNFIRIQMVAKASFLSLLGSVIDLDDVPAIVGGVKQTFLFSSLIHLSSFLFLGSPFDLDCVPKGNVLARGEGLRQAFTRQTARFEVDTTDFKDQTMEVKLFSK